MSKMRYTPRTYINELCRSVFEYKCELGYFDFGDDTYPRKYDHSIRTDAMAIKKFCKYRLGLIYNEINIVRGRKGLPPVKYMACREECLAGL